MLRCQQTAAALFETWEDAPALREQDFGAWEGIPYADLPDIGAMSGASKAWKESRDVARAEEKVDEYQEELEKIEADCEEQVEKLKAAMDPMNEKLETLTVTPLKKNCAAKAVGIAWMPYRVNAQPTLGAAW